MLAVSREEMYLAKITGEDVEVPKPVTRVEAYYYVICGNDYELFPPVTREEHYLAKIAGMDVPVPTPVTRIEHYLASIAGLFVQVPIPFTRKEKYLAKWEDPERTYTGSIVSFVTNKVKKLLKLEATLTPVQDLHGYDAPWPAGGGKNLLVPRLPSIEQEGITMTNNGDGSFKFVGTATANINFRIDQISAGSSANLRSYSAPFVMSMSSTATVGTLYLGGYKGGTWTTPSCPVNSNTKVTDNIENAFAYIRFNNGDTVNATFYPQIESGETASSWTPYSNICPIEGHTGVTVEHTGKNLWNKSESHWYRNNASDFVATVDTSSTRIRSNSLPIPCGGKNIAVSGIPSGITLIQLRGYNSAKEKIAEVNFNGGATVAVPSGVEYIHLLCGGSDFTSATNTLMESADIQVEFGSTASSYEEYSGTTYPITFPDSVGTVYGGSGDVVTGEWENGMALYKIKDLGFEVYDTLFQCMSPPKAVKVPSANNQVADGLTSSFLKAVAQTSILTTPYAVAIPLAGVIRINVPDCSTVTELNQKYGEETILYTVKTPVPFTTTPQTIETHIGQNNIWVDETDDIEVVV